MLGTKEKTIIEVSPDLRYGAVTGKEDLLRIWGARDTEATTYRAGH